MLIPTFKKLREVPGFSTIGSKFTSPNVLLSRPRELLLELICQRNSFGASTEDSLDEPTTAQMVALEDMTFCNYQKVKQQSTGRKTMYFRVRLCKK
jgi:hypothetical protein